MYGSPKLELNYRVRIDLGVEASALPIKQKKEEKG